MTGCTDESPVDARSCRHARTSKGIQYGRHAARYDEYFHFLGERSTGIQEVYTRQGTTQLEGSQKSGEEQGSSL